MADTTRAEPQEGFLARHAGKIVLAALLSLFGFGLYLDDAQRSAKQAECEAAPGFVFDRRSELCLAGRRMK